MSHGGASLSRREAICGCAAAAFAACLPGCKDNKAFSCLDMSGLTSDEVTARQIVAYVDYTTESGKDCANCTQYVKPPSGGCGTCKVVKGPIHPKGYCKVYAATS